jgi:MFS transporter, AAHS family, 3-hydroxyphenylpropionic acid transporter
LLVWGLAVGGLLSGLQAWLPPFALLLLSRVPEGAAHLAIMVAAPTLLMQVCAARHHTIVMGMWATVVGVAFALMAGLDRLLPGGLGPQGALAGHGVLMLLAAAAVRLWLPDSPAQPAKAEPGSLLALHRTVYAHLQTALPGLAFFAYAFVTIALLTFVPRFSGQGSAAFATALPLVATVGTLAAGWAARHFHTGLSLARAAYLAFAASALALAWAAHSGAPTAALALLTLGCAGVCGGAAATLIPQLNTTPAAQARASGVLVQLGNLGSVSGPPLFAAVAERFALPGLAGLALLSALAALWGLAAAQRRL